jgi:hypothetical protein
MPLSLSTVWCPLILGYIERVARSRRRQGVSWQLRHYCKHWIHLYSTGPGHRVVDTFLIYIVAHSFFCFCENGAFGEDVEPKSAFAHSADDV